MSESHSDPSRHEDRERLVAASDDVFAFGSEAEATDDTPTIISRNGPRPLPLDGAVTGSLRGWRLAHFELIEPIGVGGMAAVLRARDTQLDRLVALKILPPDMAQDPENVRRFHQEARSAAKLDHENIARVFFCGEDQRLHFIAFEFVEGENLRTILERRGRLPVAEALHCVLQVAAGLAHAARRSVVHRDIKPSNIIVMPNGRAKLVDMGLARTLEPQNDKGLTQSGVTLGTFDYISPEQALEPREADVRSDIYSLGCTFYHMITGQPPVPEGTAAKKLHHHQHIRPVDPRQLVHDLPDEVALILDRMMAKQARDRYQTPEHLVQHLLVAARKMGLAPELPEGVLLVEADLPQPPGHRPFLLVALAAAAVVGLIFLLDPTPAPAPPPRNPVTAAPKDKGDPAPPGNSSVEKDPPVRPVGDGEKNPGGKTPRRPEVAHVQVRTAAELVSWLEQNAQAPVKDIVVAGNLNLNELLKEKDSPRGEQKLTRPELVIRGKSVTVRALESRQPIVRLTYSSSVALDPKSPWTALTIESDEARVEGLRFLVDGTSASVNLIALRLRGHRHTVSNCRFDQARPSLSSDGVMNFDGGKQMMPVEDPRLASLVVESGDLALSSCCFLGYRADQAEEGPLPLPEPLKGSESGGQDAVVGRGSVTIKAEQCAFGPHETVFRLDGTNFEMPPAATLVHCSVMAGRRSSVFRVTGAGEPVVVTQQSLFARGGTYGAMNEDEDAVLFRHEPSVRVNFQDAGSRYFLNSYWANEDGSSRKRFTDSAAQLDSSPWKAEQPFAILDSVQPYRAFLVQASLLNVGARPADQLVGVQRLGSVNFLELLRKQQKEPFNTLYVVPNEDNSSQGIYPSLAQAVLAARPGDRILLKKNGRMDLEPIVFKDTVDLTIRPAPGFHPVLTLGEGVRDLDRVLFRLRFGKLVLEDLEFLIQPPEPVGAESLVSLVGHGECIFKGCVVTLGGKDSKARRAVVVLPKSDLVMAPKNPGARTADQGPRLELNGCFLRGEGDVIWSPVSRPCEVEVRNTLAAMTGSLLNVETGREESAGSTQKVQLLLQRVTTYLKGPLLRLGKDGKAPSILPVRCEATGCLFVPGVENGCLIHLGIAQEGDTGDERLKERLTWVGSDDAFGEFGRWVELQWAEEMMERRGLQRWQDLAGGVREKYNVKGFSGLSESFAQVLPRQLRLQEPLKDCGAPDNVPVPVATEASRR